MAQLLGVGEKSLARLETTAPWTPSMSRLVNLIAESRVGDLPRLLGALTADIAPDIAGQLLDSALGAVNKRVAELRGGDETLLRELIQRTPRPRRWVYWATSARTSRDHTAELADSDGVICRPVYRAGDTPVAVVPYLSRLRVGDDILLCHNGDPVRWYRLLTASRGKAPRNAPENLPFVRYIPASTPLGQALAQHSYHLYDGGPARRDGTFSALAVRPLEAPLGTPAPRPPGIRDTMTPFRGLSADD